MSTELTKIQPASEDGASFERNRTTARLGGQTLYVLLGNIFTLIVGFPLQIYVSRTLGADGVGTYGLIEGGIATFSGLFSFGIAQTLVRFVPFHVARQEYGSVRAVVRFGALILVIVGVAGYLAMLGSLEWIGSRWPQVAAHAGLVALMGAMIPLGLILYFLQQGLRGFQEIKYMVIGSSVVQLLAKGAITIATFAAGWGLFGYGVAVVASTFISVLWMGLGLYKKLRSLPEGTATYSKVNRDMWYHFAIVIYLGSLLSSTGYLDRFIIGYFAGASAVGIFLIASQLQQLPGTFNQILIMVGAPMFAAAYGRKDTAERQHIFTLMTDWVIRASLPLMIFLMVFGRPILGLYGPEFATGGLNVLLILVAARFFNLACGPVGNLVTMSGLERKGLKIDVASTCLGIGSAVLLIPFLGVIGAAMAFAVRWVFVSVCLIIVARRHLQIRWWDRRFLGWILPALASCVVGIGVRESGVEIGAIGLVAVLVVMYAVFLGTSVLQGLNSDDKDLLRHLRIEVLRWKYT